jgi:hypothetical protein
MQFNYIAAFYGHDTLATSLLLLKKDLPLSPGGLLDVASCSRTGLVVLG